MPKTFLARRPVVLAVGCLLLTLIAGGAFWADRATDQPDLADIRLDPDNAVLVAQGRQVYADACASCHGAALEGQPNWQQRNAAGRLPAPPHDPSGHTWHHPDTVLFLLTKYGPAALMNDSGYLSDMPAYEGVLSDGEIVAVLSYIKSTWPRQIRARHDAINLRAAGG
ncbi:MAG: cytochrome c [Thalassobaculaceae bacterium]